MDRDAEPDLARLAREPANADRQAGGAHGDRARIDAERGRLLENIYRGEFIRRIHSLPSLSTPLVSRLDRLLAAGRATGQFRSDVDAVDVHMVISAYCVFQVANQHTFRYLFGRDLTAPANRDHLRAMIGDVVVGWITAH